MIRSGTVKSSYQEILNRHSNLHLGFVQGLVVFFWFGWFLWRWGWSCTSKDCTEHKCIQNLLLKASILLSVLRHSKTSTGSENTYIHKHLMWARGWKYRSINPDEICISPQVVPQQHWKKNRKSLITGFISRHQWNNAGTWFNLILRKNSANLNHSLAATLQNPGSISESEYRVTLTKAGWHLWAHRSTHLCTVAHHKDLTAMAQE